MAEEKSDVAAPAPTPTPAKAKATKKKASKLKKPVNHPKYSDMIQEAIGALKERGGSSRQAILKYILKNFNVGNDEKTSNQHLKMSLRGGVKNGSLKQSKGTGASGSFRIGEKATKKPTKKAKAGKPKKIRKPKKATPKKATSPKKTKSPKKATKPKKAAAAKPKKAAAAKPKKAAAKPKKAAAKPKKAAAKPKKAAAKPKAAAKSD